MSWSTRDSTFTVKVITPILFLSGSSDCQPDNTPSGPAAEWRGGLSPGRYACAEK